MERALVKLNEGVSGRGNALVRLDGLPAPGAPDERRGSRDAVRSMAAEHAGLSVDAYLAELERPGRIVEERVTGESCAARASSCG